MVEPAEAGCGAGVAGGVVEPAEAGCGAGVAGGVVEPAKAGDAPSAAGMPGACGAVWGDDALDAGAAGCGAAGTGPGGTMSVTVEGAVSSVAPQASAARLSVPAHTIAKSRRTIVSALRGRWLLGSAVECMWPLTGAQEFGAAEFAR